MKTKAEEYREHAANCGELASQQTERPKRKRYERMAEAWRALRRRTRLVGWESIAWGEVDRYTDSTMPMKTYELAIAVSVFKALDKAHLVPGDADLAKASSLALPEHSMSGDLFRENTFIAIRNLRQAIDEGEDDERLNALYAAALAAVCLWGEARS